MAKSRVSEAERLYSFVNHSARRLREMDRQLEVISERLQALETLVEQGPMGPTELAALHGVSVSGTCRLVREMGKIGLVRARPEAKDPRRVRIEPTAAGRRLLARIRQQRVKVFRDQLAKLSARDRAALGRALAALEPPAIAR